MYEDDIKDEFFMKWKIKNFSYAQTKTGEVIRSPSFVVELLDDTKWSLSVYPRGKDSEGYIDISVNRDKDDYGGSEIPIIFTIELEAADSTRQERKVSEKSVFERGSSFGFAKYIKRDTLMSMKSTFLPDDILTIHCKLERAVDDSNHIKDYVIETFNDTVKLELDWSIKEWREIGDNDDVYQDANFTGEFASTFRMIIHKSKDSDSQLILKMIKVEPEGVDSFVRCRISIVDSEGSERFVRTTCHRYNFTANIASENLFDINEIKDSYLQDGVLTLRCVLDMETGRNATYKTTHVTASPDDENLEQVIQKELVEDYKNMYISGNFSDVVIKCDGKVVNCHQSILRARSEVMNDLLDKAEDSSDDCIVIDITDLDYDTLEKMVYFMYTDEVNNLKYISAMKLFVAAHKYKISYLKQKCSLILRTTFNFENIYDILVAAHRHEDGDLKRSVILYMDEYFSRICLTKEWENFMNTEKEIYTQTSREIRDRLF